MRVLRLPPKGSPEDWGRLHGQTFRKEICELAEIRLENTVARGIFASADEALKVAKFHLPVLMNFDRALHSEVMGIAQGSGCAPAQILLLNHYNDLWTLEAGKSEKAGSVRVASAGNAVDDHTGVRPPEAETYVPDEGPIQLGPPEEDCSSAMVRTPEGSLLGHTWDMHASAQPYLTMIHVPIENPEDPFGVKGAWFLSLTGCLGAMGINDAGVSVATTGLTVSDARIGVIWPAMVRRALRERTAKAGRDLLLNSAMGSGRHYLLADRSLAYGVETTGVYRRVVFGGPGRTYVHTNHALSPDLSDIVSTTPESTSHKRFEYLASQTKDFPVRSALDLWERMGSHDAMPESICNHLPTDQDPHQVVTCAGIVALLDQRKLWIAEGCLNGAEPEVYGFDDQGESA